MWQQVKAERLAAEPGAPPVPARAVGAHLRLPSPLARATPRAHGPPHTHASPGLRAPTGRAAYLAWRRAPSSSPLRRAAHRPASSVRRAPAAQPVPRVAPLSVSRRRHGDRAAVAAGPRGRRRDEGQAGARGGAGSARTRLLTRGRAWPPMAPDLGAGPRQIPARPGRPRGRGGGAGLCAARRQPPGPGLWARAR